VKPRKMDERLKRLAESMEDLPIKGTTRIAWSCLTEREKMLYDKTDLIAQKPFYRNQLSESELLARADEIFEDTQLLAKWHELYLRRIVDVFVTAFPHLSALDLDDDVAEWYFMLHFCNFLKACMHKRINNTQIYINLEQAIFSLGDNSEYTTRIAKTVRGARVLLEAGFEYVTDMDGFKIFRKRK
jgi:hypothetical protein